MGGEPGRQSASIFAAHLGPRRHQPPPPRFGARSARRRPQVAIGALPVLAPAAVAGRVVGRRRMRVFGQPRAPGRVQSLHRPPVKGGIIPSTWVSRPDSAGRRVVTRVPARRLGSLSAMRQQPVEIPAPMSNRNECTRESRPRPRSWATGRGHGVARPVPETESIKRRLGGAHRRERADLEVLARLRLVFLVGVRGRGAIKMVIGWRIQG